MNSVPRLEITIAAASDVGAVREHNEDHFLVGDLDAGKLVELAEPWQAQVDRGPLLVVCDGMGGVEGGEVASELAAQVIWREMKNTGATRDPEVFARLLRRATRVANHDVHAMSKREPGLRGMGTTVSAAGIAGDRLVVATVGDSRAYVLRNGEIVQVTRDQSLSIIELRHGDRILLCSDGLHGLVADPALRLLMSQPHTIAEAVSLLVTAARAAGGSDNITAVVADVGGERLVPPKGDDDLPTFREFDPQKEGDPALTSTSYVARRLAAKIGLPTSSIPPSIPVTGQHAVLRSRVGMRVPSTALPIDDIDGPARQRLRTAPIAWWWYVLAGIAACAIAWVAGGR